jgi:hypothetical protein
MSTRPHPESRMTATVVLCDAIFVINDTILLPNDQSPNNSRSTFTSNMKPTNLYSRLIQDEEKKDRPREDYGWHQKVQFIVLLVLGAVTCGILGYLACPNALHHFRTATTEQPSRTVLHCGNSSMEARDRGCVFDLLTNNWLPQYCSDPLTDAEYRAWVLDPGRKLGSWAFYHDDKAELQVASEEELSNLVGRRVYTTTENHLGHCTFLARRMHRLVTGNISAVAHNTLAHTIHCTSAILESLGSLKQANESHIGSMFEVGVVTCVL